MIHAAKPAAPGAPVPRGERRGYAVVAVLYLLGLCGS